MPSGDLSVSVLDDGHVKSAKTMQALSIFVKESIIDFVAEWCCALV